MPNHATITLSVKQIFYVLLLVELMLFGLDYLVYFERIFQSKELYKVVDITKEANLPTWFSSFQTLLVAVAAWLVSFQRREEGAKGSSRAWTAMALFFLFLAIDDTSQIHERLGNVTKEVTSGRVADSWFVRMVHDYPSYYWHLVILPFFALCGVLMALFLWRDFQHYALLLLFLLGMLCYGSAILLDYLEGLGHLGRMAVHFKLTTSQYRHLLRAVEEVIEMVGTTLILVSFLEQWRRLAFKEGKSILHMEMKE